MHSNADIVSSPGGRIEAEQDHEETSQSSLNHAVNGHVGNGHALNGHAMQARTTHGHAGSTRGSKLNRAARVVPAPYFRYKPLVGKILSFFLLVPGSFLILGLVILVRLTSKGPGIYCQVRVGKNGREFKMYKIRTMYQDAESRFGPEWTRKNDPRITPIGRWLRKLHLDEFPQLFNVLRGEMSLIGPRPERPEFTRVLAREIPDYLDRLQVLPGITGLAQINLPPDMDLESVRRKLILDLEYIEQATPFLDARMFLSTFLRLLFINGDLAMKVMKLERDIPKFPTADSDSASIHRTPDSILTSQHAHGKESRPNSPHLDPLPSETELESSAAQKKKKKPQDDRLTHR